MREIKFRGKRIDNGEWIYGYYIELAEAAVGILGFPKKDINGEYIVTIEPYIYDLEDEGSFEDNLVKVISKTIGQYTGLKDKNGNEIYEGDIIKHISGTIAEVYWNKDSLSFMFRNPKTKGIIMLYTDEIKTCEVIGNICENKVLNG